MGLLDGVGRGLILDQCPEGSLLSEYRRERRPILRCDRCGCWAGKNRDGQLCHICTGGTVRYVQPALSLGGSQLPSADAA